MSSGYFFLVTLQGVVPFSFVFYTTKNMSYILSSLVLQKSPSILGLDVIVSFSVLRTVQLLNVILLFE